MIYCDFLPVNHPLVAPLHYSLLPWYDSSSRGQRLVPPVLTSWHSVLNSAHQSVMLRYVKWAVAHHRALTLAVAFLPYAPPPQISCQQDQRCEDSSRHWLPHSLQVLRVNAIAIACLESWLPFGTSPFAAFFLFFFIFPRFTHSVRETVIRLA